MKLTPGGVGSIFAAAFAPAESLAFDSAGNLYVATLGNRTIQKFTPAGVGSVFADSGDGLGSPIGLAFGRPGPVPEPASAMLLFGSGAMLLLRRRRAVTR